MHIRSIIIVCVALSNTMASLGVSGRELDTGNKQRWSSVTSTCISVWMPLSATTSLDEEAIGLVYRGFRGQCMKGRYNWEWTKSILALKKNSRLRKRHREKIGRTLKRCYEKAKFTSFFARPSWLLHLGSQWQYLYWKCTQAFWVIDILWICVGSPKNSI